MPSVTACWHEIVRVVATTHHIPLELCYFILWSPFRRSAWSVGTGGLESSDSTLPSYMDKDNCCGSRSTILLGDQHKEQMLLFTQVQANVM